MLQQAIIITQLPIGVLDRSDDVAIELSGALVGCYRGLEETAESASLDQCGKDLGAGVSGARALEQTHHRVLRPALVDLQKRVQIVGDGQLRVQLQGSLEALLGLSNVLFPIFAAFADQPMAPS